MNQVVAAVILFGVVTAVFTPLIAETGSQMFSRTDSVSDSMESARRQVGQVLVATHAYQGNGTSLITVSVSNIGVSDISVREVLVDGTASRFVLKDQDGAPADLLEAGSLGVIEVTGAGDRVQVVTSTGKLFDFYVR